MLKRKLLKLVPKVDDEFRSLIPPLSGEEYHQLEANLIAHGCRDALVLWRGLLLDGHNRLTICNRHRLAYDTTEIELPDREDAKLWIEEHQFGRRNLSNDQKAALAFRIMQRRVAISKKQRASKGGASRGTGRNLVVHGGHQEKSTPRQRELAAKEQNISARKLREIGSLAKIDSAIVANIINGEISLRDAKEAMRDRVRQRKITAALETHVRGEGIHTGPMKQLFRLLDDDSVSLFISEPPPWEKKALPLYTELAKLAQQKLKPNGFCLVLCGQLYLNEIIARLSEVLDWYWLCAVKLDDDANGGRIWPRKMTNRFKPILMFTKRPAPTQAENQWVADLVHRPKADTAHQEHGQSVGDSQYYVEHLTLPGELVVDPFVSEGTVPVICKAMGRRFVGTELNPGVAAAARARVASTRSVQEAEGAIPVSHQRIIRDKIAEQETASPSIEDWESLDRSIENAVVKEISIPEARPIIEKYEWLGSLSSFIVACFGIFFDNVCGGVVVYSVDYAENLGVWDEYGYTGKIVCLSRGACVHWAHKHAGSKLIRTSMKMLPEKYKIVTALCDEQAGEIGCLYQATNFDFVQMKGSGNRASIIGPDGKHMSDRQAYDIYGTRSIKKLRKLGLNVVSVPRKNRYFAFLGSKKEKRENRRAIEHLIQPYPKRPIQ
jgi:hypothetical protein